MFSTAGVCKFRWSGVLGWGASSSASNLLRGLKRGGMSSRLAVGILVMSVITADKNVRESVMHLSFGLDIDTAKRTIFSVLVLFVC